MLTIEFTNSSYSDSDLLASNNFISTTTSFSKFIMYSQPSNERKKQRAATWFSNPSFFRFKLKPAFLSHSRSSESSKSHSSSLSSDPSLSRTQSPSSTTSKDSIYASSARPSVSDQAGASIKKSSTKMRRNLDAAASSKFEAPVPIRSTSSRPIHLTAPQTTPDYRKPIRNFFATIPMVPGVCA